jgi:3-mercaptopyruvate sulfurtransferase SseA
MVERKDVEAALAARRELGRDYEPEIVEAFLEKIEQRLEKLPPPTLPRQHRPGSITPLVLGSMGIAAGATAIAVTHNQSWLAVVAWIAIVIINVAYARR